MPGLKVVCILNFRIESFQITNYKSSTSSPIPIPCHRDQKALKKSSSPDLETLKIPLFFFRKIFRFFQVWFRPYSGIIPEKAGKNGKFSRKKRNLKFQGQALACLISLLSLHHLIPTQPSPLPC